MTKKSIFIALGIVVIAFGAAFGISAFTARFGTATSPEGASSSTPPVSMAGWRTYRSQTFGFSFAYPPAWQNSGDPLTAVNPHIFFGNPLGGTTTYRMNVLVYNNPQGLSAENYVREMVASDTAADVRSGAASGTAPRIAPQFSREFAFTTAQGLSAYELYGVFEFDHDAEQIYVEDGSNIIVFDFPVADANPNIADPVGNNAVAHAIVSTLTLSH